jgi:hypothetical protein
MFASLGFGASFKREYSVFAVLVVSILCIAFFVEQISLCQGEEPSHSDPLAARDLILANIQKNYSLLKTIRCRLSFQNVFSQATRESLVKLEEAESEADRTDSISVDPIEKQESTRQIVTHIDGDRLRFDGSWLTDSAVVIIEQDILSVLYRNSYAPEGKEKTNNSINIYDRHTSTGLYHDPREVFFDESLRVEEVLLHTPPNSVEYIDSPEGSGYVVLDFPSSPGNGPLQISFDAQKGMLPVICWQVIGKPEHAMLVSTEVEYLHTSVRGDDAWFPSKIEFKFWGMPSKFSSEFPGLNDEWISKHVYRIDNVSFDEVISEAIYELPYADGTYVLDHQKGESHIVGLHVAPMQPRSGSFWQSWYMTSFLVAIVSLLAYLRVRRRQVK